MEIVMKKDAKWGERWHPTLIWMEKELAIKQLHCLPL